MAEKLESVHVHRIDVRHTLEEYRQKGYELVEKTTPTITAQKGFVKLIFRQVSPPPSDEKQTP